MVQTGITGFRASSTTMSEPRVGCLDRPLDGGCSHVTWWDWSDCHDIDAWESEGACGAFGTNFPGPAVAKVVSELSRR